MTNGLTAQLRELLPASGRPPIARIEVGILAYACLKARSAPPENPWPQAIPPQLLGVPLVMSGGMDPAAWRILDRDGNVIKEGAL